MTDVARPEIEARGRTLVACIVALADHPEHVRELGAMLLELLEPGWSRDGEAAPHETPSASEKEPTNAVVHMDPLELTIAATRSRPKTTAMSDAERSRKYRRLKAEAKAAARAADPRQLPLSSVTPVTQRHAPDVTVVTASVTRDVTPSSSDLLSSPRLTKSLGEERESSPESSRSVTRDAVTGVTGVTLAEVIPGHLRQMFVDELAHRPGVELDVHALWKKFRDKNPTVESVTKLHFQWRHWCRTEEPTRKKTKATPAPATTAAGSSPELAAVTGPGVRSAPVDDEERSRRVEREGRERRAREAATLEQQKQASGIRELVKAQLGDMFTPEAMEAARAAVLATERRAS